MIGVFVCNGPSEPHLVVLMTHSWIPGWMEKLKRSADRLPAASSLNPIHDWPIFSASH